MKLHKYYIRKYKKNSILLVLSMSLSVALIVGILISLHTNHRIEAKQNMFIYTALDYSISDLKEEQIQKLGKNKQLLHLGISRLKDIKYTKKGQHASIIEANEDEIIAVSKLLEGRMPETSDEVAAEKWALQNLGVIPKVGNSFSLANNDGNNKRTYHIVGILNDTALSKMAGSISLYTVLEMKNTNYSDYTAMLKFKSNVKPKQAITNITKNLNIASNKAKPNVWKEDTKELFIMDIEIIILLTAIGCIIILGVYRILFISRQNQYGIFRAIGMKYNRLKEIVLRELLELFLWSVPIGIAFGVISAHIISFISKDRNISIYFWGEKDLFLMVVPVVQIIIGILLLCICVLGVGYFCVKSLKKRSIINVINGVEIKKENKVKKSYRNSNIKSYVGLGLRYIYTNLKSTVFIVLSISFGGCLFFGLGYQALLCQENNTFNRNLNYYNSDYIMTTYDDMTIGAGIKGETLKHIKKIDGISEIETQVALPVKVVDKGEKRNDEYINEHNGYVKRDYGFSLSNKCQGEEIYLTKLKGYSTNALKALHDYIKEGSFDPENMQEDSVIIAMPVTSTYGSSKGAVGYFKQGDSLIQYKRGDKIKVKYRSDFDTSSENYWKCTDNNSNYMDKEYKITAIVYYPYMKTASQLEQIYPLLITSEENVKKIVPKITYDSININSTFGQSLALQDKIEDQLIKLAVENQNTTARSMIEEKNKMDIIYHKELVYVFGIAVVVFMLELINITNNLKYRVQIRKNEFGIYRAIGMKNKTIMKLICFENMILGCISLLIIFIISQPIARFLYEYSEIYIYGISFRYNYYIFLAIVVFVFGIGYAISKFLGGSIAQESVLEEINDYE